MRNAASSAAGSDRSFLYAVYTRKKRAFRTQHLTVGASLASQGTDHDQTWRGYAPLNGESSLSSLRTVGGLFLEVSLGTGEPDPFQYNIFPIGNDLLCCIAKS